MPVQKSESECVTIPVPVRLALCLPLGPVAVVVVAADEPVVPLLYCELSPCEIWPELMRVFETP